MSSAFSIIVGFTLLVVFLSGVIAIAGVLVFCGAHAFALSAFFADGQCSASDQPKEVFGSFAIFGLIAGIVLSAIWGIYRFFLALLARHHP